MPVFVCSKCLHVDNTGTSRFRTYLSNNEPALCSKCDPVLNRWHNRFPRRKPTISYDPSIHGPLHPRYQWVVDHDESGKLIVTLPNGD